MLTTDPRLPNRWQYVLLCARCAAEKPSGVSPREWARTQTGVCADGSLQIWCNRHDCNVAVVAR